MAASDAGSPAAESLRRLRQIDDCCDRFLQRWKAGERPRIEDELAAAGPALADELLPELLSLEIELRAADGQTVSFREYCERFSRLDSALIRQAIDRVAFGSSPGGQTPTLSDVQLAADSLACSAQELADSVVRHGLAGASIVDRVRRRLPADKGTDATALLAELTAAGCITPYQAERVRAGRITDLVFGDYVILDRIGRGGMGDVLKARQRRMDRVVALKVVSERGLKNSSALERFQQEVRAAAHLQHANIVTAFDAGQERGMPYLVMEYVAGEDLSTRIRRDGPLSIEQAVECLRQAAKGLDYAHRKGVVHRDIKPANLLLDDEGNVKILDLGLARVQSQLAVSIDSETETGGDLTASGDVLGTLDYLPPEQAESSRRADARSDVYSLGCTLWWLLTGRAVYVRETKVERLVAHREAPVPSLLEARPDAPAELADLCRRMLAKRPNDRPQSMREVLDAIKPLATGDSTLTSRPDETRQADPALTAFLRASDPTMVRARAASQPAARMGVWRWLPWGVLAAVFGGLIATAVIIVRLNTPEGTLVLEINQPDARVQVFDEKGTVEINQPAGKGKITFSVEPGRHEVRVEKDGFRLYAEKFSVVHGETETIEARLVATEGAPTEVGSIPSAQVWSDDALLPAIAPFDAGQALRHQEAWAAHLGVPVEYTNSIGMKFRLIPPGEFLMGSTPEEIAAAVAAVGDDPATVRMIESEGPAHRVTLTRPFYLGIHEVTQGQYAAVMGKNPAHFAAGGAAKDAVAGIDTAEFPVEMVNWTDSLKFCAQLSERDTFDPCYRQAEDKFELLDGTGYRLPTEAEWEFACRAGTTTNYSSGNTVADLHQVGWDGSNSQATHQVGLLPTNPFGLHDLHGNVWERMEDEFQFETYGNSPVVDPRHFNAEAPARVSRGGGWAFLYLNARSAHRSAIEANARSPHIGFRVVLSVEAVRQANSP